MKKSTLQIAFGIRCKELRAMTGISQEAFAHKIGMDRSYFASIETGRRNVTLNNISKIAKGFDISLSKLFENME